MQSKERNGFVFLLILLVLQCNEISSQLSNNYLGSDSAEVNDAGSDFYIAFAQNSLPTSPERRIFVTTDEPSGANFTLESSHSAALSAGFPLNYFIQYEEGIWIDIPTGLIVSGTSASERMKSIHLTVQNEKKVKVYGFADDVASSDAFLALSCDSMRQSAYSRYDYLALTAGVHMLATSIQVLMISCDPSTDVTVFPSQPLSFIFPGLTASPTNAGPGQLSASSTISANEGDALLVVATQDISGTVIQSTGPLVVYIAHECANVPTAQGACDLLVEQIPPHFTWGTTFFLTPIAYRQTGDIYQVGTLVDGTQINVTCSTPGSGTSSSLALPNATIDRGEWIEFSTLDNDMCTLESSNPVLVVQYIQGSTVDGLDGDPSSIMVPPITQYVSNYTQISITGTSGSFPNRYINLAVHSNFETNVTLTMNGSNSVTYIDSNWNPFYCSSGVICGWGRHYSIGQGLYYIRHEEPGAAVGVTSYGMQNDNSYAFPLGSALADIAGTYIECPSEVEASVGTVSIECIRNGYVPLRSDISVETLSTSPQQAVAGTHFVYHQEQLRYVPGLTSASFMLTILDDGMFNTNSYSPQFVIEVLSVRNSVVIVPNITVSIISTDVLVGLASQSVAVSEDVGNFEVEIEVTGNVSNVTSVRLWTVSGTAQSNVNFVPVDVTIQLYAGNSSLTVPVQIINVDSSIQPDTSFSIRLNLTQPTPLVYLGYDLMTVNITDDDQMLIGFAANTLVFSENNGTTVVEVVVMNPSPMSFQVNLTVNYGTTGVLDFDTSLATLPTTLPIQPNSTLITFSVWALQDSMKEMTECFSLSLVPVDSYVAILQGNGTVTICIEDDDTIEVGFAATSFFIAENYGIANIAITKQGLTTLSISIDVGVVYISAGVNDFSTNLGTLPSAISFLPTESSKMLLIRSAQDTETEGTECFFLTLESNANVTIPVVDRRATICIEDDDTVQMSFSQSQLNVSEGSAAAVSIELTKQGDAKIATQVTVLRNFNTTESADFTTTFASLPINISFQANENSMTYNLQPVQDSVAEPTECLLLSLATAGGPVTLSQPSTLTICIEDDDIPQLQFNSSSYTVSENGSSVSVCLLLNRVSYVNITISVSTSESSPPNATGDIDFELISQSVEIEAGQLEACVTVSIYNNTEYSNSSKEFEVTFLIADESLAVPGSISTATVVITEDDEMPVPTHTNEERELDTTAIAIGLSTTSSIVTVIPLSLFGLWIAFALFRKSNRKNKVEDANEEEEEEEEEKGETKEPTAANNQPPENPPPESKPVAEGAAAAENGQVDGTLADSGGPVDGQPQGEGGEQQTPETGQTDNQPVDNNNNDNHNDGQVENGVAEQDGPVESQQQPPETQETVPTQES